ncbi:MAG: Ppx/GppA family phosphatase [Methanoregulaceae archaeon]|nr:Ppx/GppA family phosphatase [Methanoregulaceae archaeon]
MSLPDPGTGPDDGRIDRSFDNPGGTTHQLTSERVVAFLDIGTNSVRLLVVRINPNGSYRVLTRQKEVVRLGEGSFQEERLLPDAIDRCVSVCRRLMALACSFHPEEVVAVATAATREAGNCNDLLARLRHEADLDVRIISGREEARLIYLGVASGIHLDGRTALFIDIGGGSTEIAIGDRFTYSYLESFRLGAIRLTNRFFPDQQEKPVSRRRYDEIRGYAKDVLIRTAQDLPGEEIGLGIGSSGTIISIAEIVGKNGIGKAGTGSFSRAELRKAAVLLCSVPLEKRRTIPGINPDRADIIIAGTAILEAVMESFGIDRVVTTQRGLQDGLLEDYLSRIAEFPLMQDLSLRERSIIQLGRSFGINELHARTVTRLALDLFDSSRDLGLHSLNDADRELLEYAAFLHDIGSFIAYTNHHAHSFYIIRNVGLPGFNRVEQEFMAQITRHHRKKVPGGKYGPMEDLDRETQKRVRILSTFLRLAETLDRSHAALVRQARFTGRKKDGACLEITARGDCQLEVWGVEYEQRAFEKIFSIPLLVDVVLEEARPGEGHPEELQDPGLL